MNAPKTPQIGAERRPGPFTGVAVDLASAVPIIIAGPFVDPMADGGMGWMTTVIALPFIGVQDRVLPRNILGDEVGAGALVRVVTHPKTLLSGSCDPKQDESSRRDL